MILSLGATRHRSEALGRQALFVGGSAVAELPPYLTVQMVRFYYKADVQQKAKILRKVRSPQHLESLLIARPWRPRDDRQLNRVIVHQILLWPAAG